MRFVDVVPVQVTLSESRGELISVRRRRVEEAQGLR